MPGLRLLLILAAIVAVVLIARRLISSNKKMPTSSKKGDHDKVGQIAQCSQCGVHVPASELVEQGGKYVCSECRDS